MATSTTIIAAVGSSGAVVALAALVREARRQNRLDESAQARRFGGYIREDEPLPSRVVTVTVVNASDLPVRDVAGIICRADDRTELTRVTCPVVLPGGPMPLPAAWFPADPSLALVLVLEFDDDAGVRWRKYGVKKPLERVESE